MIIPQLNARSLIANGQEFKGFIKGLRNKPLFVFRKLGKWGRVHNICRARNAIKEKIGH